MAYEELEKRFNLSAGAIEPLMLEDAACKYRSFVTKGRCSFIRKAKKPRNSRKILAPRDDLKIVQREIGRFLSARLRPHGIAHAYVGGRGIVTNATRHIGATSILHVDLVGFFGSIRSSSVETCLRDVLRDFSEGDISAIVSLCCYEGFLPQGSPASPILSNLVCRSMDEELSALARSVGCRVTRYSDDICFSASDGGIPCELASVSCRGPNQKVRLGSTLRVLIERHGFMINMRKLRLQTHPDRLTVTGLTVGERINVPKLIRRHLRVLLDQWERHGIGETARNYRPNMTVCAFVMSLKGCIEYVGQVAGRDNPQYRRFVTSFEALLARDRSQLGVDAAL